MSRFSEVHPERIEQVFVEGSGSSRSEIFNGPTSLNALTTRQGASSQKPHQNWEEDPAIGFVLVESSLSDPSYEQCRPCKSELELSHIIDNGPRVTPLRSSSVHKRWDTNSSVSTATATSIHMHKVKLLQKCKLEQLSRCFSTSMDKFPMEKVLGFHKDPWWRSSVESIRNIALYGDTKAQETRLRDILSINTDKRCNKRRAAIYCTWNRCNINLVDLPSQDKYSLSRALRVIDGAVLFLCAINSVSNANVDSDMRRNGVARIIFIENIDKIGADPWRVISEVREKLQLRSAALQIPIGLGPCFQGFVDIVECKAHYFHKIGIHAVPNQLQGLVYGKRKELLSLLSKVDPSLVVDSSSKLKEAIRRATVGKQFVPVYIGGSVEFNKSLQSICEGIFIYLPCPHEVNCIAIDHDRNDKKVILSGNPEGSLVGLVFSSEEGNELSDLSYIRVHQGMLRKGSIIFNVITKEKLEITVLFRVFSHGLKEVEHAIAGEIVATCGINVVPGDTLTDGTVDCTIPCTRGLSLRPIEVGAFHKLFGPILEDRSNLRAGESLHGASIKTGFEMAMRHNLLSLYGPHNKLESVIKILEFTEDFNMKLLNSLIHGFAKRAPLYSLAAFRKLLHLGPPTDVTFRGIIRAYRPLMRRPEGKRKKLVNSILVSMETYDVPIERRHRLGLVDILLGGGEFGEAFKMMEVVCFDEQIITSFLHAYLTFRAKLVSEETTEKKKRELFKKIVETFLAKMKDSGIHYTIHVSLKQRLLSHRITIPDNVSYSSVPKYSFIREEGTDEKVPDS